MSLDVAGFRVVVTGGSRSIGRAMALGFARAGASVSICARGEAALNATRAELAALGQAHAACCDLADAESVDAYVDAAAAALGGIDMVVNNATCLARGNAESDWAAEFSVDLMGSVRMIRAAEPWLIRSLRPSILNIASVSALHPTPMAPAYGAVKAALVHLTRTEALRLAVHRVRVNAIAPGAIESPDNIWGERRRSGDAALSRKLERMPFGRLGTPEEIADAALFLGSDMARWITGQILVVDGGESLRG